MAKERSLDIFDLLSKIDQKDLHIWEKLSDIQRKEFAPLVVLRWLRGTDNKTQLMLLNELINPVLFNIGNEKEFLLKLMSVCSIGGKKRYSWINSKTSSKKQKLKLEVISKYCQISIKQSEEIHKIYSNDDIISMSEELGYQKDEISNLKKELK